MEWECSENRRVHDFTRQIIIGDGTCLFGAMPEQIRYGEGQHREIRERIVQTINADREYFAPFIDEDQVGGEDKYCDEMVEEGIFSIF